MVDPTTATRDDHAVAVRVSVSDEYDVLKHRLVRMLLSTGASIGEAHEHAHDAVVETYLGADRVAAVEAVLGYGATIAKRSLWRERRRVERSLPVAVSELPDEPSPAPAPTVRLERDDRLKVMGEAFAELSQRDRDLLWQRHVDGASCAELAEAHGLSLSSVPTVLLRIRRRLRDLLAPHEIRQ